MANAASFNREVFMGHVLRRVVFGWAIFKLDEQDAPLDDRPLYRTREDARNVVRYPHLAAEVEVVKFPKVGKV